MKIHISQLFGQVIVEFKFKFDSILFFFYILVLYGLVSFSQFTNSGMIDLIGPHSFLFILIPF